MDALKVKHFRSPGRVATAIAAKKQFKVSVGPRSAKVVAELQQRELEEVNKEATMAQVKNSGRKVPRHRRHKKNPVRLRDGTISTDFKSILNEQRQFYARLYSRRDVNENGEFMFRYLQEISPNYLTKVTDRDKFALDQEITIHEIYDSIKTMKSGKCPGIDGLPIEFYRTFFPDLKWVLLDLYKEVYIDREFHLSARQSLITLLDKPGRDLLEIDNWHPLSLLNCDYKIWDKLLANRMYTVLPYIIKDYQTGFMRGRNISDNLMQLMSIIEHCDLEQADTILISYDFYKAFDVVCHPSL